MLMSFCLVFFFFLVGGYETFYSEYPDCCVDVEPVSQEKIETERALIGPCGKPALSVSYRPAYDQVRGVYVLSRSWLPFLPRHPDSSSPCSAALVACFVDQGFGRALQL